jgi:uncharacterized repeat protein (TIGR01451 family)
MEVGKMPAQRKTNQSRGLTAAGLIAVTAATLLMMAWAIFPTAAFADGTHVWGVDDNKQGAPKLPCATGAHWIFQFTGPVTAAILHVDGEPPITMTLQGGHFVGDSSGPVDASTSVSVTWTGSGDGDFLTLSHCLGVTPNLGITKSATSTQVNEGGAVSYTITVTNTGDGDATGVVVTDNLHDALTAVSATFDGPGANDGSCAVDAVNQITCNIGTLGPNQSATVTINATAPQLPLTEGGPCTLELPNQATVDSEQTAPETSNQVTVTVTGTGCTSGGGGGGGGGGTTTTPPPAPTTTPIVAPTTVTNTSTTPANEVLPTTVRPGKLAFTGIEDVVPIGALALTLMTTGSGLLWAGSRRRRHDGSEDED